jgi:hypothetical protein
MRRTRGVEVADLMLIEVGHCELPLSAPPAPSLIACQLARLTCCALHAAARANSSCMLAACVERSWPESLRQFEALAAASAAKRANREKKIEHVLRCRARSIQGGAVYLARCARPPRRSRPRRTSHAYHRVPHGAYHRLLPPLPTRLLLSERAGLLERLHELLASRGANRSRAHVQGWPASAAALFRTLASPLFFVMQMVAPASGAPVANIRIVPSSLPSVLPSPRAEPSLGSEASEGFGSSILPAVLLFLLGGCIAALLYRGFCAARKQVASMPTSPPSPPPMVAEEEDLNPVSRRRTEIAALSSEEYDSLEAANLEALRLSNVSTVNPFRRGAKANQQGVQVTLTCNCHLQSKAMRRCSAAVPTRAHAAELLLADVTAKHAECIRDRDRWSEGETSAAPTAFSHISEVQRKASEVAAACQREAEQQQKVRAAKKAVEAAARAELNAVLEREAAEAALAELKEAVRATKRQKAADGAAASSTDVEAVAESAEQNEDEPSWRSWTLSRWRKHESELQERRSVVINPKNTDKSLPPRGDEDRGWRRHWRRGLIGSIQDWAEGRKHRVVFMLAELARYFGVQREV